MGSLGRLVILTGSIHPALSLDPPTIGQSQLKRQLSVLYENLAFPYLAQPSSRMQLALSLFSLPSGWGLGPVD